MISLGGINHSVSIIFERLMQEHCEMIGEREEKEDRRAAKEALVTV